MRYLMLKDKQVVETADVMEWLASYEEGMWRVERTKLDSGTEISTDFFKTMTFEGDDLGGGFESMVMNGKFEGLRVRFDTWEQAEKGHALFVAHIEGLEAAARKEEGAES